MRYNSQAHYAKGTRSLGLRSAPTACKRTVSGSVSLRLSRFFSPFPHGTGSLSVSREYLALPDGAGSFRQGFSGPALLRIPSPEQILPVRGSHPLRPRFPTHSGSSVRFPTVLQPPRVNTEVWAAPLSLATTCGITFVFSSSPYLDVSVREVRHSLCSSNIGVSPFGHPRINVLLQLPAAFRSLTRPSSPARAQASPVRSCKLPALQRDSFCEASRRFSGHLIKSASSSRLLNNSALTSALPLHFDSDNEYLLRYNVSQPLFSVLFLQSVNELFKIIGNQTYPHSANRFHSPSSQCKQAGFEPAKDRLSFIYTPSFFPPLLVEDKRFELLTPCVQGRCSSQLS